MLTHILELRTNHLRHLAKILRERLDRKEAPQENEPETKALLDDVELRLRTHEHIRKTSSRPWKPGKP